MIFLRVHRLISILLLIESKGKIKAKELAEKLETSIRTIYRDIDTLCEAGIPITSTRGPEGGVHFMEGYSVGMDDLRRDDIVNLYLSGKGIHPDIQSEMGLKLHNALLKLEKKLPSKYKDEITKVQTRFYFDDKPWWSERPEFPYIDILINSVWDSKKLRIKYRKVNEDISVRTIHPYGIVVKRMAWYVIAHCENRNEIRTFRCERITDVEEIEEIFTIPQRFSLGEFWMKNEIVFKKNCTITDKYLAVIQVKDKGAHVLKELEVVQTKHQQDFIVATVNMYNYEYACDKIIDIIGHSEVLEPVELRDYTRQKLMDNLELYKDASRDV